MSEEIARVIEKIKIKNPGEREFHQAITEVLESLEPVVKAKPDLVKKKILERIVEPERQVMFRCSWRDEKGEIQVNRGYRIQFNSAIGPYKGGLRFHPSVNLSIIKFLGFEQIFKNALTGLPMGGAKGGSDIDPKGKSDTDMESFCHQFMSELWRHIGPNTDVPAGDIGVGAREIGFLFGKYKKITNRFESVLTGKGPAWGGSILRPEATGFGASYFCNEMLNARGENIKGKIVCISGSGNVSQYAIEKMTELGAKVVTVSDSNGYVYDPDGIDKKKLEFILDLKNVNRGRIKEYADKFNVDYVPDKRPWEVKCDIAMPCATENEIDGNDAQKLVDNGVIAVVEGANMPSTLEATKIFLESGVSFAPGKAANAGGVATSGLEMTQNAIRLSWGRDEVDKQLHLIMANIHQSCYDAAKKYGGKGSNKVANYVMGANTAGFLKVAAAMIEQGLL